MDNALKLSPKGGKVTVGEEGGAFFVRHQGMGFDLAHAGKLFTAFERLVDQNRFKGTGVGLAIVRHVVEKRDAKGRTERLPAERTPILLTIDCRSTYIQVRSHDRRLSLYCVGC